MRGLRAANAHFGRVLRGCLTVFGGEVNALGKCGRGNHGSNPLLTASFFQTTFGKLKARPLDAYLIGSTAKK